ncbi:hypothetical protein [Hymenobacter cellulosivorans]|uniref:Uncharacterized protein n=1 Tax=Hymenobacter cellulosivorans TaxID=2932249 RepID=A0ABY4F957_9BACT|nr:hypothetical protein [Hymenobacter cellulosivorans]UOQ53053.1 hypothetical protein MUN80_25365 [Hymenobacter cellulosivorans]
MTKRNPVSFINEHTAEYYLAPAAVQALSHQGIKAMPFFFWGTREGSKVGVDSGADIDARIVAIYPRRPKVEFVGSDEVYVKINASLIEAATVGAELGVPVFAGAPIVSSLFDLSDKAPCLWFDIDLAESPDDITHCISVKSLSIITSTRTGSSVVSDQDLFTRVIQSATPRPWSECVETLRQFRRKLQYEGSFRSFFGAFGGYKPFYVVLVETTI